MLAGSALALFAATSGCNTASGAGETTIRFWAMGREGEVVRDLLPEFERRNPGIHVRVQQMPWTAAHEKLLTGFVGDATPEQYEIWSNLIECKYLVMDLIKPGASCPEVYRKFLQKFSALGFEPISFVAHGIGLHLHEEPYMGRYGNEVVEAGMVGAFEPLVYIPGRFGMQNKDMFCVTDKGCELLSDVTPTDTLLRVG